MSIYLNYVAFVCRDLEEGLSPDQQGLAGHQSLYQIYDEKEERLKQLLASLKSMSAKEDFIRTLR